MKRPDLRSGRPSPHGRIAYLSPDEVRRLLESTTDDPLGTLYTLAASTGLRPASSAGSAGPNPPDGIRPADRDASALPGHDGSPSRRSRPAS